MREKITKNYNIEEVIDHSFNERWFNHLRQYANEVNEQAREIQKENPKCLLRKIKQEIYKSDAIYSLETNQGNNINFVPYKYFSMEDEIVPEENNEFAKKIIAYYSEYPKLKDQINRGANYKEINGECNRYTREVLNQDKNHQFDYGSLNKLFLEMIHKYSNELIKNGFSDAELTKDNIYALSPERLILLINTFLINHIQYDMEIVGNSNKGDAADMVRLEPILQNGQGVCRHISSLAQEIFNSFLVNKETETNKRNNVFLLNFQEKGLQHAFNIAIKVHPNGDIDCSPLDPTFAIKRKEKNIYDRIDATRTHHINYIQYLYKFMPPDLVTYKDSKIPKQEDKLVEIFKKYIDFNTRNIFIKSYDEYEEMIRIVLSTPCKHSELQRRLTIYKQTINLLLDDEYFKETIKDPTERGRILSLFKIVQNRAETDVESTNTLFKKSEELFNIYNLVDYHSRRKSHFGDSFREKRITGLNKQKEQSYLLIETLKQSFQFLPKEIENILLRAEEVIKKEPDDRKKMISDRYLDYLNEYLHSFIEIAEFIFMAETKSDSFDAQKIKLCPDLTAGNFDLQFILSSKLDRDTYNSRKSLVVDDQKPLLAIIINSFKKIRDLIEVQEKKFDEKIGNSTEKLNKKIIIFKEVKNDLHKLYEINFNDEYNTLNSLFEKYLDLDKIITPVELNNDDKDQANKQIHERFFTSFLNLLKELKITNKYLMKDLTNIFSLRRQEKFYYFLDSFRIKYLDQIKKLQDLGYKFDFSDIGSDMNALMEYVEIIKKKRNYFNPNNQEQINLIHKLFLE